MLVIGDVMLDHYLYGSTDRVSPEAPVPVVRVEREIYRIGGAGNVSANVAALGGRVKKPPNIKLGEYVKKRPDVFRVTGDQVELVNA